jgi:hypothetical protein
MARDLRWILHFLSADALGRRSAERDRPRVGVSSFFEALGPDDGVIGVTLDGPSDVKRETRRGACSPPDRDRVRQVRRPKAAAVVPR